MLNWHEVPDAWKRSSRDLWARSVWRRKCWEMWWRQHDVNIVCKPPWELENPASNFLSLRQERKHFQWHFPWHLLWSLTQKRNWNSTIVTRDSADTVQAQLNFQGPLSSRRRERTLEGRLVPAHLSSFACDQSSKWLGIEAWMRESQAAVHTRIQMQLKWLTCETRVTRGNDATRDKRVTHAKLWLTSTVWIRNK